MKQKNKIKLDSLLKIIQNKVQDNETSLLSGEFDIKVKTFQGVISDVHMISDEKLKI